MVDVKGSNVSSSTSVNRCIDISRQDYDGIRRQLTRLRQHSYKKKTPGSFFTPSSSLQEKLEVFNQIEQQTRDNQPTNPEKQNQPSINYYSVSSQEKQKIEQMIR